MMPSLVRSLGVLVFSTLLPVAIQAQDIGGGAATKENLDLPYDAIGEKGIIEDPPETVRFYTQQLEGDALVYVIDRSGSMADGELEVAKRELLRNIAEFSDRMEFGIVFFDAGILRFPASGAPAVATSAMKAAASGFVRGVQPGRGSCIERGLAEGLRMASLSTKGRKVLVYLGDGGGTCPGADEADYLRRTLGSITSQNYQRVTIDTIGILDPRPLNEDFLKRLAAANGGTYVRVR